MLERSFGSNAYYNVRDPITGRWTRTEPNGKEHFVMTIDNDTHEQITETLPAITNEDAMTIRQRFQSVADAFVNMSSVAKEVATMKADMDLLRGQITEANARLEDMRRERDEARAGEAKAKQDAAMAREAYDTVNAKRQEAEQRLEAVKEAHNNLFAEHGKLTADHSFRGDEISRLDNLLNLAREERDRYRDENVQLNIDVENAEFKLLEFDEMKQNLDIARKALDDCASTVVDWKGKAHSFETELSASKLEAATLRDKINHTEDALTRMTDQRDKLNLSIANIRLQLP